MKKKVIIIIISLAAIALLLYIVFSQEKENHNVLINETILSVGGNEVYLRAMSWGLSGGHSVVALSDRPFLPKDRHVVHGVDVVFYTNVIYFKIQNDSCLNVAVVSSAVHPENNYTINGISIELTLLRYNDDIKQFEKNFEEKGYLKLEACP